MTKFRIWLLLATFLFAGGARAAWFSVDFPDASARCAALADGEDPVQAVAAASSSRPQVETVKLPDGAVEKTVTVDGKSYRFANMFGACVALASSAKVPQKAPAESRIALQCNFSGGGIVLVDIDYSKHKVDVGSGRVDAAFDDDRIRWLDPFYGQMTLERKTGRLLMMSRSSVVRGMCSKRSSGNKF